MRTAISQAANSSSSHTAPQDQNTVAPSMTTSNLMAPADELRHRFTAVLLSIRWLGVRKTLSQDQKQQAADPFGAEAHVLSAAKKLLDTRHSAYKAVTAVRGQAVSYWKGTSLPYPEPGLRLIRQDAIAEFNRRMIALQQELAEAVADLDSVYGELQEAARQRLGRLYDATDYPPTLSGLFAIEWDFPSVDPPNYLQQLNPTIYEQEQRRIAARFDEAVHLAEEAFTTEFAKLVTHLTDRLEGGPDGRPKIFRDSAVDNLGTFFERFRNLNIHSNEQLDRLVEQARQAVRGVRPQDLRSRHTLRQHVGRQLKAVQNQLDDLLVDRPRRRILRSSPTTRDKGE